jgi:hypothetical protein
MVAIKSCSHIFHRKCIIRWTESWGLQRDTCPSCRAVMYQYVPMTAWEIEEMEAAQGTEAQGIHAQILELYHEAQYLWLESLRRSALDTSRFYDGPELQQMTDWEDGATTAPLEETPTIAGTISSPQTLVLANPEHTLVDPADVDSALGPWSTSPPYSPSTPSYYTLSPERVSAVFSPTYTPVSSSRPMAPGPTSPPRAPFESQSSRLSPSISSSYQNRSPLYEAFGTDHANETQLVQVRHLISTAFTIVKEIHGVAIVSHVRRQTSDTYQVLLYPSGSEQVHGALGYAMVDRTAIFYA